MLTKTFARDRSEAVSTLVMVIIEASLGSFRSVATMLLISWRIREFIRSMRRLIGGTSGQGGLVGPEALLQLGLVGLQNVTFLEIGEALEDHASLQTRRQISYIVFEVLEAGYRPAKYGLIISQDAYLATA